MAGGQHQPHASKTDLEDMIPYRIRRPVGKQTATCRDIVFGRLRHKLRRASTTGCGSRSHVPISDVFQLSPSVFKDPERYKYTEEQITNITAINQFLMYFSCLHLYLKTWRGTSILRNRSLILQHEPISDVFQLSPSVFKDLERYKYTEEQITNITAINQFLMYFSCLHLYLKTWRGSSILRNRSLILQQ